jgi:CheY-like chemotaxis protein
MANVLLVEDDADSREALRLYLEKSGHTVRTSGDARAALSEILDQRPDVVVLDLLMPEVDGSSLLEVARSYVRLQSLPFVVLSALGEGPLLDRARNAKVSAILKKSEASLAQIKSAVEDAAR